MTGVEQSIGLLSQALLEGRLVEAHGTESVIGDTRWNGLPGQVVPDAGLGGLCMRIRPGVDRETGSKVVLAQFLQLLFRRHRNPRAHGPFHLALLGPAPDASNGHVESEGLARTTHQHADVAAIFQEDAATGRAGERRGRSLIVDLAVTPGEDTAGLRHHTIRDGIGSDLTEQRTHVNDTRAHAGNLVVEVEVDTVLAEVLCTNPEDREVFAVVSITVGEDFAVHLHLADPSTVLIILADDLRILPLDNRFLAALVKNFTGRAQVFDDVACCPE